MITWVNINGFSPNLVCASILCSSGLGLLMGKFRQILSELSAPDTPIFSFPDNNLSKHQWIFTKLGTCIDIVEIWFGIANGQIFSVFDWVICPQYDNGGVLSFTFLFLENKAWHFIWMEIVIWNIKPCFFLWGRVVGRGNQENYNCCLLLKSLLHTKY